MRAKVFLFAVVIMVSSLALPAQAQQPKKAPRIGWMEFSGSRGPSFEAFLEGLRERGYMQGQNINIEYRSGEGREDRLAEVAAELVSLKVNALVADTNAATVAAQKATTRIPIVFIYGDPVGDGLISSLARPGGNLTGLIFLF